MRKVGTGRATSLLTVPEAAARANVSERMIRRLISERRIPFHHLGRHVRVAEGDLLRFIESGRVEASHPESRHIFGDRR